MGDLGQNPSAVMIGVYVFITILTSIIAPVIVEWFKNRKKATGTVTDPVEEDFEIKSMRLQYEMDILREHSERLAQKTKRAIFFVRTKDPALEYILQDLEREMGDLGFDPTPGKVSISDKTLRPSTPSEQVINPLEPPS